MSGWKFIASFTAGPSFEFVPGHNIWDYTWKRVLRDPPVPRTGNAWVDASAEYEVATVPDPLYGGTHQFPVYEVTVEDRVVRFACSEFSNNIWGYYVPESDA
jgi:hypothetical protein